MVATYWLRSSIYGLLNLMDYFPASARFKACQIAAETMCKKDMIVTGKATTYHIPNPGGEVKLETFIP